MSSLEGVCAALMPPEHGGPDPKQLSATIERSLKMMPAINRRALKAAAHALDAFAVTRYGHRLSSLTIDQREHVIELADRYSSTSLALEGLSAVVCLAGGAMRVSDDLRARSLRTPPARPDPVLDVTEGRWWPSTARADVVVIGSGAGGAMAARTLARSGLDVIVVEEGRRFGVDEFRTRSPLERFGELYRDGGSTIAFGRIPIVLPIGCGVGGTTLVNSGTCFRTPERVLERWRDDARLPLADPSTFAGYLDEVERTLQVKAVPEDVMGNNGRLALLGAMKLGWDAGPIIRDAPGCMGSGQCAIGCPRNAKFGVHLNALPEACDAGARILSSVRVDRILHEAGRAVGVIARRADGSKVRIYASRVVVAAGATETPPLLRRSGLAGHSRIGKNLAVHPATSVSGRFDEEVYGWHGVLQSAYVDEFHDSHGILLEATMPPPGMGSATLPGFGRRLLHELDNAHHLASVGLMVADRSTGSVLGAKRTVIRYDVGRTDIERLLEGMRFTGHLLFAAGARSVLTGISSMGDAYSEDEFDSQIASLDTRRLHLAAFHPTGTVAAGTDEEKRPADHNGALRGVRGVWIADASLLPSSPEVNPQVTIMALALAVADRIVDGT